MGNQETTEGYFLNSTLYHQGLHPFKLLQILATYNARAIILHVSNPCRFLTSLKLLEFSLDYRKATTSIYLNPLGISVC